ncbi:hypothetical protein [Pseudoalteromonas umbrosa]|uniref:hypothetical protein n=1 Tax=Pseudoalteromonas umbrosa TaxID=3048489 RepID=UPI0024C37398|nr:hypothetical protein [Pseudoalteromonas sp. B95]MDK1288415.1 hypothetical protein [Pseudoalteromonas sp. B95]
MYNGQYSIYYKSQSANNLSEKNFFVQSNYIVAVNTLESGDFQLTFMKGFEEFLAASIYPTFDINFSAIKSCDSFEFIVFNDPDYGIHISQNSLPDERLLSVLRDVTRGNEAAITDIFQLLQAQIIRDFETIRLGELDSTHLDADKSKVLEHNTNRVKLFKHEQVSTGSKYSTLDMKRILGVEDDTNNEFDVMVAAAWDAPHSDRAYHSSGLQYVSHELDKADQLTYYEFVYQSWLPLKHKRIERKIIRID